MRNTMYIFALAALLMPGVASAEVPGQIHYQGRLADAAGVPIHCPSADDCPSGAVKIVFRLYDKAVDGDLLWEETWENVSVANGVVDVKSFS
mgnify:CR=1 FL=1